MRGLAAAPLLRYDFYAKITPKAVDTLPPAVQKVVDIAMRHGTAHCETTVGLRMMPEAALNISRKLVGLSVDRDALMAKQRAPLTEFRDTSMRLLSEALRRASDTRCVLRIPASDDSCQLLEWEAGLAQIEHGFEGWFNDTHRATRNRTHFNAGGMVLSFAGALGSIYGDFFSAALPLTITFLVETGISMSSALHLYHFDRAAAGGTQAYYDLFKTYQRGYLFGFDDGDIPPPIPPVIRESLKAQDNA